MIENTNGGNARRANAPVTCIGADKRPLNNKLDLNSAGKMVVPATEKLSASEATPR